MQEFKPVKEGKVREIYDNGDNMIIVATDRISAFDDILKNKITDKGAVLTQMSKFWFDYTKDVVPNHMVSTDVKDMPEFFQNDKFAGRSMMCKKLEMLPIECIVRGYITGSGWASYKENGTVCGIKLPEGLVESDKLPEPIYTPSTKAEIGLHDENISFEQSVEVLEKAYPGKGAEYAEKIKDCTIALYKKSYSGLSNLKEILEPAWEPSLQNRHYDLSLLMEKKRVLRPINSHLQEELLQSSSFLRYNSETDKVKEPNWYLFRRTRLSGEPKPPYPISINEFS